MSPDLSKPSSIQHTNSPRNWTFVSKRRQQFRKLVQILPSQSFRRGLRYGVAASVENHTVMKSIRPATLIDVGANVGQFSLLIRTLYPDAYIHAFEPLSRPAGRFTRLFKGDDLTTLHRCAIGPLSGSATMHVTGDDDGSSLLVPVAGKTVGVEQVAVRRLDEVLNGTDDIVRPVLLKLDTQGSELSALRSCGSLLDKVDFVYIEVAFIESYLGQPMADEVVKYLFGCDFSLTAVNDPQFNEAGRCLQADFLFSRCSRASACNSMAMV